MSQVTRGVTADELLAMLDSCMDLSEAEQYYGNIGFADRVGFGRHPALLIIDCNHGCADPSISPIGIPMHAELNHIRQLLDLSRAKGFPVVYTTWCIVKASCAMGGGL